jgi:hypothetical protein
MSQIELFHPSQSFSAKSAIDKFNRELPPALGTILRETWTPKYTAVLGKRRFQELDKDEKEWNDSQKLLFGEAFHKRMQQHLNREPLWHYCDDVEAYFRSVQKSGILEKIGKPRLVEKSVPWPGDYPYTAKPDAVAPYNGSFYPIQWTTKTEPIAAVEQLGDKLAQVTGEWKALEDYFNDKITGALVVVAYPQGKATIITIERSRLAQFWENHLSSRLKRFYDNHMKLAF